MTPQVETPLSRRLYSTQRYHRDVLILALVVVLAAFLLQVTQDDRVALLGYPEVVLPPTCPTYYWFGVRCPGCGLTRSFVHLARADWASSWKAHRLGWLLAAAALAQIPYRLHELVWERKRPWVSWLGRWFALLVMVLLVLNWLLELVVGRFA